MTSLWKELKYVHFASAWALCVPEDVLSLRKYNIDNVTNNLTLELRLRKNQVGIRMVFRHSQLLLHLDSQNGICMYASRQKSFYEVLRCFDNSVHHGLSKSIFIALSLSPSLQWYTYSASRSSPWRGPIRKDTRMLKGPRTICKRISRMWTQTMAFAWSVFRFALLSDFQAALITNRSITRPIHIYAL